MSLSRRSPQRKWSRRRPAAVLQRLNKGEGRYEPRPVKLGVQGDDYVQVLEGVKAGEPVVVSANFLIDAESNLKAALGSFGVPAAEPSATPAPQGH